MQLNYRQYSDHGKPLLILHGLFGSLSNWGWHSKQLARTYAVYGIDLRNHGDSPHSNELNYQLMSEDVKQFMDQLQITTCYLIGHSMGGKVAMQLALTYPQFVGKLIVVDIAPIAYSDKADGHLNVMSGMNTLNIEQLESRKQAELHLAEYIEDEATRQFILTNLVRDADGTYRWRLNLSAIQQQYDRLREKPIATEAYMKPTLFVKGALSNYIQAKDEAEILELFPTATVKIIMHAGHWLHADKPKAFQKIASDFLSQVEDK